MPDYLLDTNIVRYWYDEHANVLSRIDTVRRPDPQTHYTSRLFTSAVTRGEIEYGHRVAPEPDPVRQAEYLRFMEAQQLEVLEIDRHTADAYGRLKAWLFNHRAPRIDRSKAKRAEELVRPRAARELGVGENDLWIAAQAVTLNLVLVTHDKLANLREALLAEYPHFQLEDWTG
ncbi:MAG TPA: PIN domain-containing protein [Phycisphaerae bacterium]|nr:PIN domain-containing protein [Phycisphaerae bacterium]